MDAGEVSYTLDDHFAGKHPVAKELYDEVMELLSSIGPVKAEPKKTCIHLVRKSALGGITVRKDSILLEFKTDYPIDSSSLTKSEQVSRNRFHHTMKLTTPRALTEDVKCWLKDAYDLSA